MLHKDAKRMDADDLYREEVLRARKQPIEDKILDGIELFDFACEMTKAGIRMQNPGFTDKEVESELRRRLDLGRRLEDVP